MAKEKDFKDTSYCVGIPSYVLHCKELPKGARLLYIEIATWCEQIGYCLQKNEYLSKVIGVSTVTISKWIKQLYDKKFIQCEYEGIYKRIIFLWDTDKWIVEKYKKEFKNGQITNYKKWGKHDGWIYLLRYEKFFKIDITQSRNPNKRLNVYNNYNPFKKEIIFCEYISDYIKIEEIIKVKFSHKCKKGTTEWFIFSDKDVSKIKEFVLKKRKQYLLKKKHKVELKETHKVELMDTQSRVNDIPKVYGTPVLETGVPEDNTSFIDDFNIETKEYVNKEGQTIGIDTIDYEEES